MLFTVQLLKMANAISHSPVTHLVSVSCRKINFEKPVNRFGKGGVALRGSSNHRPLASACSLRLPQKRTQPEIALKRSSALSQFTIFHQDFTQSGRTFLNFK